MKKFSVSIDWATIHGNPETTTAYVFAANASEAMDKLRKLVSKKRSFWKTQGGSAAELTSN